MGAHTLVALPSPLPGPGLHGIAGEGLPPGRLLPKAGTANDTQLANILAPLRAAHAMYVSAFLALRPSGLVLRYGTFLPTINLKNIRQLGVLLVRSQHTLPHQRCPNDAMATPKGSSLLSQSQAMFVFCFFVRQHKATYLRDLDRRLRGHTCFGAMTPLVPGEGLSRASIDLLGGSHHVTCSLQNVADCSSPYIASTLARCNYRESFRYR